MDGWMDMAAPKTLKERVTALECIIDNLYVRQYKVETLPNRPSSVEKRLNEMVPQGWRLYYIIPHTGEQWIMAIWERSYNGQQ